MVVPHGDEHDDELYEHASVYADDGHDDGVAAVAVGADNAGLYSERIKV